MVRLRTLTATTVLTVSLTLAGCGGDTGSAPTAATTPQFAPTAAVPSTGGPAGVGSTDAAGESPPRNAPSSSAPPRLGVPNSGAKPSTGAGTGASRYVFPIVADNVDFHPTHSKYPGTDLFADCGKPVVAVTDGRILEVSRTDSYVKGRPDGPLNGGLSVSLLGDDGVRYYGSHLSTVQAGIEAGARVRAGQRLGQVGRTGNANGVCHLHFGISPPCAETGDWKVRRGVVWPAPYLTSWRKKGAKSPATEVAAWKDAHNCQA